MKFGAKSTNFEGQNLEFFSKFATESELLSQFFNETVQGVDTACLGCQGVGNREPNWVWLLGCGIRSEKVLNFMVDFR